jgi:hypothetical protein
MPDEAEELRACLRYYQNNIQLVFSGNVSVSQAYYAMTTMAVVPRTPPALSGTPSSQTSFPAALGTLNFLQSMYVREFRAANAAGVASFFSTVTANARM